MTTITINMNTTIPTNTLLRPDKSFPLDAYVIRVYLKRLTIRKIQNVSVD